MNRERVQMLRDMIAGIPEKRMALDNFYKQNGAACKTIACIAGWAAIYPPFVEQGFTSGMHDSGMFKTVHFSGLVGTKAAARFFIVPKETFFYKFPHESGSDKEVALRRLDRLLKARKPSARVEAK